MTTVPGSQTVAPHNITAAVADLRTEINRSLPFDLRAGALAALGQVREATLGPDPKPEGA
jgi:hypothetical protein